MLHLIFAAALAQPVRAFTERFTCAGEDASLVNVVVRGRGHLPVTREMPVTARIQELTINDQVARDVVLQGWANMSASGTFFELDSVHASPIVALTLSMFGPAAIVAADGRRSALDCGGAALFAEARIDETSQED